MKYELGFMDEYEDYHTTFLGTFEDTDAGLAAFDKFLIELGDQPAGSWLELWDCSTYETIKEHNY